MTLQECYAEIGGDYEDVVARLRSDRLVQKFLLRFLEDKSYELFCTSMKEKNYEEAFRAVHTIKGICQNLSFTKLLKSSSEMSDALRNGWTPKADELVGALSEDYKQTADGIRRFREELGGE